MKTKSKKRPQLKPCENCNETGYIEGIFTRMVCNNCSGLGRVNKETGKALSDHDVIECLMVKILRKDQQIESLQARIKKAPFDQRNAVYPPGSRHE